MIKKSFVKILKSITNKNDFLFSSLPKTTQLKNLIQSKDLDFIMEAHNGLSSKIVEETGFKGNNYFFF